MLEAGCSAVSLSKIIFIFSLMSEIYSRLASFWVSPIFVGGKSYAIQEPITNLLQRGLLDSFCLTNRLLQ